MVGRPVGDAMGLPTRLKTQPIPVQRTTRPSAHRVLTSLPAGKMVPLLAIPMLREDAITGASFRVTFEMMETVELLMNAINVRVMAYLVPNLAFDRFDGMDDLNRSYQGVPRREGEPVVPWFETMPAPADIPAEAHILHYMGKHARAGTTINTSYIEAYNQIWNFRATNRSPDIALRERLDATLAPAFWQHQTFAHIVPSFDQALVDGEVALNVTKGALPVRGIGLAGAVQSVGALAVRQSGGVMSAPGVGGWFAADPPTIVAGETILGIQAQDDGSTGFPAIFAEMEANGITVSLSNIEMARKTQAFAQLRRQYHGHSDEYIIDLLMSGLSIPEQSWKYPMLLADETTQFGMSKRYASDGANLTESVVNGLTFIDVGFSCPRVPMGGVVMLVAEIAPEQLFERQKDHYLHATSVDKLPDFLRDTLDPEKVSVVLNEDVDLDHDTPTYTFGYAPLNHEWAKGIPQIGGRFYRPAVDAAFDEDRQRIWAVETQNPVLSEDFYLVTQMHYKPFVVTDVTFDPFEALVRGQAVIRGNTVFGPVLVEAMNDYAEVVEKQPTDRIDQFPDTVAGAEGVE